MSDLPAGWLPAQLSELLFGIEAGLNVKCEERPPADGEKGLVKISAVTWGKFDELQSKTLPVDAEPDERNRISAGDLLISRANTIELVGASVIVGPISRELYLSDKVLRLCVHEPSKRWINYALKTPAIRKSIEEASSGNQLSMRNISQEKLKCLSFPLAPEAEQTRIADKLDTVLARVDAVNARLERVAPLLKRFRQAVLAAATSGRLTGEWRQSRQVHPTWTRSTLGAVAIDLRYGTSQKCSVIPSGVAVLRIPNVGNHGFPDLSDLKYADFEEVEKDKLSLQMGDILIIRSNGSVDLVGKCCVVDKPAEGLLFAGYLIRLRLDLSMINPYFAFISISSPATRRSIDKTARSTSGVNNINSDEVRALKIDLPDLAEQAEIVRRVELLFGYADRLEARLKAAQTAAGRLTPALLAKAFRGELVPQDPNDEPASELLRRLAESRAAAPERKTRGRRAAA
ncbi:MAG TPA: hypothetical protein PLL72_00720 [Burkholderiaceae bacterium]|nr:hypothetical protein [Burkholderiaceae bacterium]